MTLDTFIALEKEGARLMPRLDTFTKFEVVQPTYERVPSPPVDTTRNRYPLRYIQADSRSGLSPIGPYMYLFPDLLPVHPAAVQARLAGRTSPACEGEGG